LGGGGGPRPPRPESGAALLLSADAE
jgi:hypothetical protein